MNEEPTAIEFAELLETGSISDISDEKEYIAAMLRAQHAAIKTLREALEVACGGRCNAEYNPCYARQALAATENL